MKLFISHFTKIIVLLCLCIPAYAQEKPAIVIKNEIRYFNIIKINPLSLGFGTANVQYERVLNENYAINVALTYTNANTGNNTFEGWGIQPEFKWYFVENSPQSFYVSAFTRISSIDHKRQILTQVNNENQLRDDITNFFQISPGLTLGYAYDITPWLHAEVFAGPTFRFTNQNGASYPRHIFLEDGLGIRAGVTLGYRF